MFSMVLRVRRGDFTQRWTRSHVLRNTDTDFGLAPLFTGLEVIYVWSTAYLEYISVPQGQGIKTERTEVNIRSFWGYVTWGFEGIPGCLLHQNTPDPCSHLLCLPLERTWLATRKQRQGVCSDASLCITFDVGRAHTLGIKPDFKSHSTSYYPSDLLKVLIFLESLFRHL